MPAFRFRNENAMSGVVSDIRRARGARMARRHGTGETLHSARKHLIIKEIQAAVARELATPIRGSQNNAPADRGLAARAA